MTPSSLAQTSPQNRHPINPNILCRKTKVPESGGEPVFREKVHAAICKSADRAGVQRASPFDPHHPILNQARLDKWARADIDERPEAQTPIQIERVIQRGLRIQILPRHQSPMAFGLAE